MRLITRVAPASYAEFLQLAWALRNTSQVQTTIVEKGIKV
ncbi:MAG: hypothetical protein ACJAYF_003888 [Arenicella sp.]|jgi:hypothetical protein